MATNLTQDQIDQLAHLQDLLVRDGNGNHQLLSYYLKLILNNRPIELKMSDGKPFTISPKLAWDEILKWNEKAGLPMGDKGSRQIRASRLLNYLDLVQGNTREAATNFQAIKDSAEALSKATPTTTRGQNIKKMVDIRKLQLEIHNRQAMGQLSTLLEQTSFIKRFASDRPTQIALTGLFAANAANFINSDVPKHVMAEEITKLIQLNAGRTASINNAAHLAYSQAALDSELGEISTTIGSFVSKKYKSTDEFIKETGRISHISHILTVGDIPELVDMLVPNADQQDRQNLAHALQSTVIRSTRGYYTSGDAILSDAFNLAGLPADKAENLSALAPFLEEIRATELNNTIGGNIDENDPRILNTLNISSEVGVSAHIPWLTKEDLDSQIAALQTKYGTKDLSALLQSELGNVDKADFEKISDIKKLFSNIEQRNSYDRALADNPAYYLRDKIDKTVGRFFAFRSPIDRFSQKIGKKVWAVDDFIHAPARYLANQWGKLEEMAPILNPGKFIYDKVNGVQLWIATKILDWSDSLIGKGHWATKALTHISDFSRGFINENGSWSGANYVFVQKKWGDFLDWGAKKAGFDTGWRGLQAHIGTKLWDGFAKIAPEMAGKLSAGSFGKLIASFTAGTLSAGTTIIIQIGLMLLGEAFKKIQQFFNDKKFREQIIRRLPALVGIASVSLASLPAAIVGGIIALGSGTLAVFGSAISALFTTIFLPAIIAIGAILGSIFLLYQVLQMTAQIDPGTGIQILTNILCDSPSDSSSEPSSPSTKVAYCASCLVKYLTQCYGQSVTGTKIQSKGISCIIASVITQPAADAIEASAVYYNNLQCVGFARAAALCGGSDLPGQAVASDYIRLDTLGYKFVSGVDSCQQGDFGIIDGSIGHIFVVKQKNNATITAIDANFVCPGCVSDNTPIPSNKVAGCLKKN